MYSTDHEARADYEARLEALTQAHHRAGRGKRSMTPAKPSALARAWRRTQVLH